MVERNVANAPPLSTNVRQDKKGKNENNDICFNGTDGKFMFAR